MRGSALRSEASSGEAVSLRLRELRRRAGKTQEAVAAELGVAKSTYSSWETGRNELGCSYVVPLCRCLGCTANDLFGLGRAGERHLVLVEDAVIDEEASEFTRLFSRAAPHIREAVRVILRETVKVHVPRQRA